MLEASTQTSMIDRMIGAAKLDTRIYEEVEHDESATGQALLVVVLGALAAGIGGLAGGIVGLVLGVVGALVGWGVYALLAYWVGTSFFKGRSTDATWGQLLRTLGFANSPRVLLILLLIPVFGLIVWLTVLIWTLVATVVAIRQALDFDNWRAIGTAVAAWIAQAVVYIILGALIL